MSEPTTITIKDLPEYSTWESLNEFRWISTPGRLEQGVKLLQQADRCLQDGRIKWRRIGLHLVSDDEFNEASRS